MAVKIQVKVLYASQHHNPEDLNLNYTYLPGLYIK